MRQIQLLGPVDKRAIAYPLFKVCDIMGKTLVVTDDSNFRRFGENFEREFTVGRSDFVIVNDVSKAILEELGVRLSNYDYVIFITTNELIDSNDCLVYCHGNDNLVCSDTNLDYLDAIEHIDVTISIQKPKKEKGEKAGAYLSVDTKSFAYVWECEESKMFVPCKHPELTKLSAFLFASVLSISTDEYAKTIVRDV